MLNDLHELDAPDEHRNADARPVAMSAALRAAPAQIQPAAPVLRLERLGVSLMRSGRLTPVLDDLDLAIPAGRMLALVGESGSGKTLAALSIMRLLPAGAITTGRAALARATGEQDLLSLSEAQMRSVRGRDVGMVFQNPLAALNPSHRIGKQIAESLRAHPEAAGQDARSIRASVVRLLDEVGIANAAARLDDYPHQFSGGMRQRATIAIALACGPRLLIADEPTTGLDPLVARQIMALIASLRRSRDMGVLFVTHDLSIVEEHADLVHVLYAGRTVERAAAAAFFAGNAHPYSQALLGSVPRLGQTRLRTIPGTLPEPETRPVGCRFAPRCSRHQPPCDAAYPPLAESDGPAGATAAACLYPGPTRPGELGPIIKTPDVARDALMRAPALTLDQVGVRYGSGKAATLSLAEVSFKLAQGECLGVVGESGSGKSTLGRAILQMLPYEGRISLAGKPFDELSRADKPVQRRRIQVVFQDPRESLNPRLSIGRSLGEPLRVRGFSAADARMEASRLLARVGLSPTLTDRLPSAISGGQAQRVAIARALAAEPEIIVLDEPTSSLDVSTQAAMLNLLKDLSVERGIGYIFISHDLAIVSFLANRILVLRGGKIVELAEAGTLVHDPREPYTAALVAAAPKLQGTTIGP